MGNAKFRGLLAPKLLVRFLENFAQLIMSWTPPHMQVLRSMGSKGVCLRMRELSPSGVYFFFFLGSMRLASRYRSARWTDRRR